MGLLRSLAHMIFGFLLLTALWVTALSFLSMRTSSTAVITDLGVDALNPWLVTQHIGIDTTGYAKLEQYASANPGKPLPLTFIKPQIQSSAIKGLPYSQGVQLIYNRVASAYYDGGPTATFNLPSQVAGAVQTFALFPEQYDSAVKATSLPTWLQPFMLFTGLSPETLTATGHARISALLPKFWFAALIFAGAIILLNLLGRRNPVQSLALAAIHGAWPTVAFFGILWLIGTLYPTRVQPVAPAFGVVAGAFLPVYGVALAAGAVVFALSWAGGWLAHSFGKSAGAKDARVAAPVRAGYATHPDDTPMYTPHAPGYGAQPSAPMYQQGGQQNADWNPPARQPWEQPAQPGWGAAPAPSHDPRQPGWNQSRPWDAPDPNAPTQGGQSSQGSQGSQGGQGQSWGEYRPTGPDDPTAPRW